MQKGTDSSSRQAKVSKPGVSGLWPVLHLSEGLCIVIQFVSPFLGPLFLSICCWSGKIDVSVCVPGSFFITVLWVGCPADSGGPFELCPQMAETGRADGFSPTLSLRQKRRNRDKKVEKIGTKWNIGSKMAARHLYRVVFFYDVLFSTANKGGSVCCMKTSLWITWKSGFVVFWTYKIWHCMK